MIDGYGLSLLGFMPIWAQLALIGMLCVWLIGIGSFVLARLGLSPLWILMLLVPGVNVIGIWLFAYARWPRIDGPVKRSGQG
jgi:hypothetical protein